jgi:hypothetical protein
MMMSLILIAWLCFVACVSCISSDTDKGPVFPPPGAPGNGPCTPAFFRLETVVSRIKNENAKIAGAFDSYTAFGPFQLTVKNTKWTKGFDQMKVMNDSHYLCTHDMFLEKYAVQFDLQFPPGQEVEGDIGIWAWGANYENKFVLTSTKPIIISVKWQYDDAGGWSVTQSAVIGAEHGAFEMKLKDCEIYCEAATRIFTDEIAKPDFTAFKKLAGVVYDLFKGQDMS